VKDYGLLLLILFAWTTARCYNPAADSPLPMKVMPSVDTLRLAGQKVVVHQGEGGLPKMVYLLDEKEAQDGVAVEYQENGGLLAISQWKKGLQEGDTFIFSEGQKTHQFFELGKIIYEATYQEQQKVSNRLYPTVVEEFFFEDKYYAKIRFPLPCSGELDIDVDGYQAVINPLPDQTFQLVINDALDLTEYSLKLAYQPAAQDTLLHAKYSYKHIVYGE
jgi:hypothetical protein